MTSGALVVTHAMLRRLTSWRCIIIIIKLSMDTMVNMLDTVTITAAFIFCLIHR